MDIATLLGLLIGVVVVVGAVLTGSDLWVFLNVPGFLIVLGGTFAATLVKFPIAMVFVAFRVGMKAAFGNGDSDPRALIDRAIELVRVARKSGLLALENETIRHRFFKKGVQLCVDGFEIGVIKDTLTKEMNLERRRQEIGERIFRAIGDSAPAFGMVGTLVGLVQMLSTMSDPKTIGPAMAVALLTTLYGALIAHLVAIPIADKLETKAAEDQVIKALIIEAVLGIHARQSPDVLTELLEVYLPENQRHHDEPDGVPAVPAAAGKPA